MQRGREGRSGGREGGSEARREERREEGSGPVTCSEVPKKIFLCCERIAVEFQIESWMGEQQSN